MRCSEGRLTNKMAIVTEVILILILIYGSISTHLYNKKVDFDNKQNLMDEVIRIANDGDYKFFLAQGLVIILLTVIGTYAIMKLSELENLYKLIILSINIILLVAFFKIFWSPILMVALTLSLIGSVFIWMADK